MNLVLNFVLASLDEYAFKRQIPEVGSAPDPPSGAAPPMVTHLALEHALPLAQSLSVEHVSVGPLEVSTRLGCMSESVTLGTGAFVPSWMNEKSDAKLLGSAVGDDEATRKEVGVADGFRCVVEVVDARCDEVDVAGVLRDEVEVVISPCRRLVMSVVDIIIKDRVEAGYTDKE